MTTSRGKHAVLSRAGVVLAAAGALVFTAACNDQSPVDDIDLPEVEQPFQNDGNQQDGNQQDHNPQDSGNQDGEDRDHGVERDSY